VKRAIVIVGLVAAFATTAALASSRPSITVSPAVMR